MAFVVNRPKFQRSLGSVPSFEIISLLISMEQREVNLYFDFLDVVKTIGPSVIPSVIGLYLITSSSQAAKDLIAGNKDLIATNLQVTNDLNAGNKDLIAANI